MADKTDDKTTPPPADKGPTKLTLGDLKKFIDERIGQLTKDADTAHDAATRQTETRLDRSSRIQDQVNEALARIKEKEERDQDREQLKTFGQQIQELFGRIKEEPPKEFRKVHRFMGWGE